MVSVMVSSTQQERNKQWIWILAFFAFTAASIVFSILCISNSNLPFVHAYKGLLIAVVVGLLCCLCGVSVWLILKEKHTLIKLLLSVYLFVLFCLILMLILQKTGFFRVVSSAEELQVYLESKGAWMPILYILLQYLQVILLPIPGIVSTVAGIALFGAFKTMIFSLIGILLGSITAFFIGRRLGYKAVVWMIGEETLEKWQNKLKGKDNFVLTLMFIFPLFPDDVLCFLAGLSSMSNRYFLIMITITRVISIACTCYSFGFIPWDRWWGLMIWGFFLLFIVAAFVCIYKYMDKIQRFLKKLQKKK